MKEPLVLLHGALGCKEQLLDFKTRLESKFDAHLLSFEGHGGTASKNPFSIDLFTDNVLAYCALKGLESVTIFGYSMGGYVALNLAIKHPKLVKKVYTLGTKFNWHTESAQKEVKMLNPKTNQEKAPFFTNHLKQLHCHQDWRVVMTKTAEMILNMAYVAKLIEHDFKRIEHQVIIGIGRQDNMVTYEESEKVAAMLVNGKLVSLDGVPDPIEKVDVSDLVDYVLYN
ncbi:MAG: alpha/beta hydrolase [Bacteroidetes bacterium]|jgi:pimeloyl-ACP methyl ester carboxylesterase|nr:alpha/beta hydrolase [Bacteroidota bacterium]